jgi:tetratricopeptide (TPR) repeat protein
MGMKTKAAVYAGIGVFLAAIPSFSQSTLSKQQQIESHSRRAQEFLKANKPNLAAREFSAILELDPNNLDAHGNLGVTLFFQGDYKTAAGHLRGALQRQPTLWKIQALLGMCEKRLGQMASAQSDFEKSFPQLQDPKLRIETGMELIEIYYETGNLDKAANIASALRQLDPTDTSVQYTAHRIYSDLAAESMLSIAMLAPKSARMRQVMAHEMARQGNTEGAIANYREALKLDPRLPGLHFELAEALNSSPSTSDQAEVEREYKAALADNPFDGKAECRLGEIALRASDLKNALTHYSRAVELQPNDAEANLGVAKALTSMRRAPEAEPYLKRAAQLEPFNAATHYRLSLVYRELGRTADAQRELSEYQKYKEMKERLKQVYEEMRLQPVKQERPETGLPQNLP